MAVNDLNLRRKYAFSNGVPAKDIITYNKIPIKYAIRLGTVWYDVRSLQKWVDDRIARGLPPTLPHTGMRMNKNQLNGLRRRVNVLHSQRPMRNRAWSAAKRIHRSTLNGLRRALAVLENNSNTWGHH